MKENRKVYVRQVPWEWQESPWDNEQLKIDKAALYGNRSYGGDCVTVDELRIPCL